MSEQKKILVKRLEPLSLESGEYKRICKRIDNKQKELRLKRELLFFPALRCFL